jgi:hypothetical protein
MPRLSGAGGGFDAPSDCVKKYFFRRAGYSFSSLLDHPFSCPSDYRIPV